MKEPAADSRTDLARSASKVILIHGNGGSTAADIWLPYLEREFSSLGLTVINQTFPDNVKARASIWVPYLAALGADEHTILIGHSSGAVAAMRYAESHRLLGSVLVGVCHTDLGDPFEAASGYYNAPWHWQRIRDHQQWIGIYQSTDDPHIPVSQARFVAKQLRANYFEFTDRGHFVNSREFPEAVRFVRRKLGR
jgi:predicted alpha/beta hydrolase family esterase